MPSIARLGIAVDYSDTLRAADHLNRMAKAGGRAEISTVGLSRATDVLRGKMSGAARAVGSMLGAFASYQAISGAINSARQFNSSLAETGTLLSGLPSEMAAVQGAAIRLSNRFGGTATAQVKAYYQAISAGSATVEDATALLGVANKLAIGGITTVTVGVDVLSTAINSYGSDTLSAAQASDALFVSYA